MCAWCSEEEEGEFLEDHATPASTTCDIEQPHDMTSHDNSA